MITRVRNKIANLHWAIKLLLWFMCIILFTVFDILFERFIAPMFEWNFPDILPLIIIGGISVLLIYFLFPDKKTAKNCTLERNK